MLTEPLLNDAPPKRKRFAWVAALLLLATGLVGSCIVYVSFSRSRQPEQQLMPEGTRLLIVNGCEKDPLWIAGFAVAVPVFPTKDLKLDAGASQVIPIPDSGLSSTRFWAKWGCDDLGQSCKIGQSGGPGESCGAQGCAPPVDSKFEASFGCLKKASHCAVNPSAPSEQLGHVDWWDVSQVDGWTLPYRVDLFGACDAPRTIDCSELALSQCPTSENIGLKYGKQSLQIYDPNDSSRAVGCYSPCGKLTYSQWGQGYANTPESEVARDYCCPTPPISPKECSTGPIINTSFVKAVHKLCPSVYAYAYDDGVGLSQCPAGTGYKVTFYCPK
mmetsp:Transcript_14028/g.23243  ORF Transcript_14028/g.23243 Transcript_14028/m.23243 type:complete len:330 (-) Transcript_14028:230-1219(-)